MDLLTVTVIGAALLVIVGTVAALGLCRMAADADREDERARRARSNGVPHV